MEEMAQLLSTTPIRLRETAEQVVTALADISAKDQTVGKLELEICIGCGNPNTPRWAATLPLHDTQFLLTALSHGSTQWESKSEGWEIYHDTYVLTDGKRVRLRSVGGVPEASVCKTSVLSLTACSEERQDLGFKLNAKTEVQTGGLQILLLRPESVRVSTRRTFVLRSASFPEIVYRYFVITAWTGRTSREADLAMKDQAQQGVNSLEVELELCWPNFDRSIALYGCLSLLLKAQDLLAMLCGARGFSLRRLQQYPQVLRGDGRKRKGRPRREEAGRLKFGI